MNSYKHILTFRLVRLRLSGWTWNCLKLVTLCIAPW